MYWMLCNICFGSKKKRKEDAEITWQSVSELMWLCPNGDKPRPGHSRLNIGTSFLCQRNTGNRAHTEGSPSRVKNAADHHAQAFFSFCHGCRRRAKQSPEVSIISLRPRGQEKSHYICCHTKSLSRCGGESTQQPQTPHRSPRLEPSTNSNKWDTFHSDLRERNTSLIPCVLTKSLCLKMLCAEVMVGCKEFNRKGYAI